MLFSTFMTGQEVLNYVFRPGGIMQSTSISSSDHSLTITYSISELDVESFTNENGTFYKVGIPGHTRTTETGKPELPVLSRLIEVPEGYSYKAVISDVKSTRLRPDGKKIKGIVLPAQEEETKTPQRQKPAFAIDKATYATRGFLKSDTVRIIPLGTVRKKHIANILINPVRYNPHSNVLDIITSMKVEISFIGAGTDDSKALFPESSLFNETLSKGILNYNPDSVIPGYSEQPVRMLILTDTSFRKQLDPLIKWKTQKGYKVEVLYKGAAYAGTTYTELKDTLNAIYNSSTADNPPPEYLLIVGDVSKIPYYGSGYVTDLYYGEFDGNGDYIPEMFIGRLPVKDTNDLKSVVKKIIQYEKFDFAPENKFWTNGLLTAGVDAGNALYMNGQVKYGVTNYMISGNKINDFHFYYPESGSAKDSIIKLINKGLSFVNYTGHGETNGWLYMNIYSSDTSKFTNENMYPFVISNACQTSSFELPGSFGNTLVNSSKKGAIGFIGCSSDSYWSEDFYWAVGVGTPSADPTYETTGLGALDRLFHTHGESPSDWYITMGQVNYAGNLAVSASTSSRKKYYWETYNLVGDPSIIPIIGTPDTFNIVIPDTLPNNLTSYSFVSDPFSYIAISHFDTLWDASFSSANGSVTLYLPGTANDSCLVVITGQNKIPLIKTIYFSDIADEFINLTKSGINDTPGNNNGLADFGETFFLDLTINNLGLSAAESLIASISSSSEWITVNNDSVILGTLAAGSEIITDNSLSMTVSGNVPDNTIITIDLKLKDTAVEKHYIIDLCAHAPDLEIYHFEIDDITYGNGNFIPDPGETINLIFNVRNLGSSDASGIFSVSSPGSEIETIEPAKNSGLIGSGTTIDIPVQIKLSETANSGSTVSILSLLNCPPYSIDRDFSFRIGRIRETFESESFLVFPWINISSKPWIVTESSPQEGLIAARSGIIPDNSSSSLQIRTKYDSPDTLKFWYKVSSEASYDFFIFKLNDKEVFKKSGEVPWTMRAVPVPAGYNKFDWSYKKDYSEYGGQDCALVDMIDFAVSSDVSYIDRDIATSRIVSPEEMEMTGKIPITVNLLNQSPDTINGFNLTYTINNGIPVRQHFSETLIPFSDSVTVTFNTPAYLQKQGLFEVMVYGENNNDDYPLNDTLMIQTEIKDPISVSPNPFTDELNIIIRSDSISTAHISMTSSTGQKVLDFYQDLVAEENLIQIRNGSLAPSLYILKIEFMGMTRTLKIIKQK